MLIATPISSLAIVIGKLLSALVYVFLLIVASIPLMAVVFVYGGVGPEDVLRGYIVLFATALGLGSFGLLCSSLVKRTTAATAITIFGVLAVTVGTVFVLVFWQAMSSFDDNGNRRGGRSGSDRRSSSPTSIRSSPRPTSCAGPRRPSAAAGAPPCRASCPSTDPVVFFSEPTDGGPCRHHQARFGAGPAPVIIDGKGEMPVEGDQAVGGVDRGIAIEPNQPFGVQRDALWPKSVVTWLILSVVFIFLSVQAVSPTRRWRPRRRRRVSRSAAA